MIKLVKRLKINFANHFYGIPTSLCKLQMVDMICAKLTPRQVELSQRDVYETFYRS